MRFNILVALIFYFLFLAWTVVFIRNARAEECVSPRASIQGLDIDTKTNDWKAMAWAFESPDPGYVNLYVFFEDYPDQVQYETYLKNCRVPDALSHQQRVTVKLNSAIRENLRKATVIFDNGVKHSPIESF